MNLKRTENDKLKDADVAEPTTIEGVSLIVFVAK